jgi:hypothetical protein
LKFEKNQLYDQREMKKIEICHEKLKWKFFENFIFEIWTEKSENFHFWTFFLKMAISPEGNEEFRLCHRDKTFNNVSIPPMYSTL